MLFYVYTAASFIKRRQSYEDSSEWHLSRYNGYYYTRVFKRSWIHKDKPVAVEHNGQLVSKAMYSDVVLTAADRLEIVAFVGGG